MTAIIQIARRTSQLPWFFCRSTKTERRISGHGQITVCSRVLARRIHIPLPARCFLYRQTRRDIRHNLQKMTKQS